MEADLGLELKISFVGYETEIVTTEKNLRILLKPSLKFEPLIIQAFRAKSIDPITQSTIYREEIQKKYQGEQPIFYLDKLTPSITSFRNQEQGYLMEANEASGWTRTY